MVNFWSKLTIFGHFWQNGQKWRFLIGFWSLSPSPTRFGGQNSKVSGLGQIQKFGKIAEFLGLEISQRGAGLIFGSKFGVKNNPAPLWDNFQGAKFGDFAATWPGKIAKFGDFADKNRPKLADFWRGLGIFAGAKLLGLGPGQQAWPKMAQNGPFLAGNFHSSGV